MPFQMFDAVNGKYNPMSSHLCHFYTVMPLGWPWPCVKSPMTQSCIMNTSRRKCEDRRNPTGHSSTHFLVQCSPCRPVPPSLQVQKKTAFWPRTRQEVYILHNSAFKLRQSSGAQALIRAGGALVASVRSGGRSHS